MSTLVISPHLDDAVFSLGRMIANRDDVYIITVHGGGSPDRQDEDAEAMDVLGASAEVWPYEPDAGVGRLAERLAQVGSRDQVLVPLGIYHPDHIAVADACRHVDWDAQIGVYEDIPYRIWWPDQAYQRRRLWGLPVCGEPESQAGPLDLKLKAAECYRSQLSDDIREVLSVPERVWWL